MAETSAETPAKEPKPSRTDQALAVVEQYASDLREIVKRLRRKLNG